MRNSTLGLLCIGLALAAGPASGQPASAFAGSDTCGVCHEDIFKALKKSPHERVETDNKFGNKGHACESCHGPGQAHAEAADPSKIRNPRKLTASATDRVCLTCHLNQPTHIGRLQSSHAKDAVACTTCHEIHANGGARLVVPRAEVNEQCSGCHLKSGPSFSSPITTSSPKGP